MAVPGRPGAPAKLVTRSRRIAKKQTAGKPILGMGGCAGSDFLDGNHRRQEPALVSCLLTAPRTPGNLRKAKAKGKGGGLETGPQGRNAR